MTLSRLLIVGFLCLALAGCADPVTLENFNRIKTGMSMTELGRVRVWSGLRLVNSSMLMPRLIR